MVETLFPQEPTIQVMVWRLVMSMVVGGLIGLEREYRDQPAGFRTHTLISIGATLLMFVSIAVPEWLGAGDPSRIAAQVVSGIGFLGAGAIIEFGADIRGLTTAASVWAVAAMGLGIGAGLYAASAVAVLLIVVVLAILNKLEKALFEQRLVKVLSIGVDGTSPPEQQIQQIIDDFDMRVRTVDVEYKAEENAGTVKYIVYAPRIFPVAELLKQLNGLSGVRRISVGELR